MQPEIIDIAALRGFVNGATSEAIYLVERGVRSIATIVFSESSADLVSEALLRADVGASCRRFAEGWYEVTLYRHFGVLEAANHAAQLEDGPVRDWLLGKLYGYSDEAIDNYVRTADKEE